MKQHYIGFGITMRRRVSAWLLLPAIVLSVLSGPAMTASSAAPTWTTDVPFEPPADVTSLVAANGKLYAGSPGSGLWVYGDGMWGHFSSPGNVRTLEYANGTLYAGSSGSQSVWSMGKSGELIPSSEVYGFVADLEYIDGILYAANHSSGVKQMDNSGEWSATSGNLGRVTALANANGTLYAGSDKSVWKYDKTDGTWTNVFVPPDSLVSVTDFAYANGTLHVVTNERSQAIWSMDASGNFSQTGVSLGYVNSLSVVEGTVYALSKYDGVWKTDENGTWSKIDGSPNNVTALAPLNGMLVAMVSDVGSNGMWTYSGGTWTHIPGTPGYIKELEVLNGTLYSWAGSGFWSNRNGEWTEIVTSMSTVFDLIQANGTLYAGTRSMAASDVNEVWTFETGNWARMPGSPDNVISLAYVNGTLYAATNLKVYAFLNETWSETTGTMPTGSIRVLAETDGMLYGATSQDIWTYGEGGWTLVPGSPAGVNHFVNLNGALYVESSSGIQVYKDGIWTPLSGSPSVVYSMFGLNGTLYVGAYDGVWTNRNGMWKKLDGSPYFANDFAYLNGTLFAGGSGISRIAIGSYADLSGLTISEGSLSFDADNTNYTVNVAYPIASVDITPTLADGATTMTVNGNPDTSGHAVTVPLVVGDNVIPIVVKGQDGVTTKTYTVNVTRAAASTSDHMLDVAVNVAAGKITGTTSGMEYSLDSTDGTDGNWSTASDGETLGIAFAAGNVYVREASDHTNVRSVAVIAPPAAAPNLEYDDTADTITGLTDAYEYSLDGGSTWMAGSTPPDLSGTKTIRVRTAATAAALPSEVQMIVFTPTADVAVVSTVEISGPTPINLQSGHSGTETYTVTVKDQNGAVLTGEQVTWSLQSAVDGVSVDADSGEVTVTDSAADKSMFTLVATSKTDPTKKGMLEVTISRFTLDSVISPETAPFDKNASAQANVIATMTLNGNTLQKISNGGTPLISGSDYTVTGDTVTIKKEYLAALDAGDQVFTFDMSAGTDPTLTITIGDSTPTPSVTSVVVSPASATVTQGESLQLTATVTVEGGADQTVAWTSGDASGKVAVDSSGMVKVAADAALGDYTITATSTADSSKSGTATITVTAAPVSEVPANPQNLVSVGGDSQVALEWDTVTGATYYAVYLADVPGEFGEIAVATVADSVYTIQNLTNGTTYYFIVKAGNSIGLSERSEQVSATPLSIVRPGTIPGAPTGVTASVGNGLATIRFTPPSNDGGRPITEYQVTAWKDGQAVKEGSGSSSPITVTGLTNGTAYTFTVVAVNANGTSPASVASAPVTPLSVPTSPEGLAAAPGSRQVALAWSAVGTAEFYSVKRSTTDGGPYVTIATIFTSAAYTDTGLTNGTTYYYVVTAHNAIGESANSAQVSAKPVSGSDSGSSGSDNGPAPSADPVPNSAGPLQMSVTPEQGGSGEIKDLAELKVPAGAVPTDGKISVAVVAADQVPSTGELEAVSRVVEFTSSTGHTFSKPVEITFHYDQEKIGDGRQAAVYYYNEQQHRWIYIGGTVNADGTVTVSVSHFTKFAVFEYEPAPFADLAGHWATVYTDRLVGMKVIQGYPDRTFRPDATVARAQFTKMLTEALGLPTPANVTDFADDSEIPIWSKSAVAAAVKAGLISGYPDKGAIWFKADQTITRAEMAVMIARALSADGNSADGGADRFKDAAAIPDWAQASVEAAVSAGVLNGYEDGTFRPDQQATRAEAAAMIYKLLEVLKL
ncbi:S-layer homology domain-containing protein [Paenibacillus sp. LHD-117]|uniref:S-layer homology domain-containing protein n=1 Tax=Paenibacillus sp. LHD-117 TaxID=3071412 RepID=UPI0027E12EE9|nr:S-layer homology domain-containing protein [Paenibacillus sp. LHD-117]MDQ6422853.1 S-layer homology domain-containing protein [Paenibacillus sp. LHD-117]